MKIGVLNLPGDAGYAFVFSELRDEPEDLIGMLQQVVVHEAIKSATGARSILCFEGEVKIDPSVDGHLTTEHDQQIRDMLPPTGEDLALGVLPDA